VRERTRRAVGAKQRNAYRFGGALLDSLGVRREVDACADAAAVLATEHDSGEALARWMQRYVDFIVAKRGLATALHSGNPAYETLPVYFQNRLRPALKTLLDAAVAAGEVCAGIEPNDLLRAVASLCAPAHEGNPAHPRRMVALLVDGLRYRASSLAPLSPRGSD
jgi:hypothetical protein